MGSSKLQVMFKDANQPTVTLQEATSTSSVESDCELDAGEEWLVLFERAHEIFSCNFTSGRHNTKYSDNSHYRK